MTELPAETPLGPWSSLLEYASSLLDTFGATCHRKEFSSRTYNTLLQLLYVSATSLGFLGFLLGSVLAHDRCGDCVDSLYIWVLVAISPVLHELFFVISDVNMGLVTSAWRHCSRRQWRPVDGGFTPVPAPTSKAALPRHLMALLSTLLVLVLGHHVLACTSRSFAIGGSLLLLAVSMLFSARCFVLALQHLRSMERRARRCERERLRQRLASNILTIADIMEVQSTSGPQRFACATLRQQSVLQCPEVPGDERSCCLCLQRFSFVEEITRTICGHVFHTQCLGAWLQTQTGRHSRPTCPLCRSELAGDLQWPPPSPPPPMLPGPALLGSAGRGADATDDWTPVDIV